MGECILKTVLGTIEKLDSSANLGGRRETKNVEQKKRPHPPLFPFPSRLAWQSTTLPRYVPAPDALSRRVRLLTFFCPLCYRSEWSLSSTGTLPSPMSATSTRSSRQYSVSSCLTGALWCAARTEEIGLLTSSRVPYEPTSGRSSLRPQSRPPSTSSSKRPTWSTTWASSSSRSTLESPAPSVRVLVQD